MIEKIKKYALENNVPIIEEDGKKFLCELIEVNRLNNILEIGSAIGYSAIVMASLSNNIFVSTIERDEQRYNVAKKNISETGLSHQIEIFLADALEFDESKLSIKYDLLFIDAAKAQSQKFLEKYIDSLKKDGLILIDNINFHGFANGTRETNNRNTKQLVRKINRFKDWLATNNDYVSEYYDIGDGILVARRND